MKTITTMYFVAAMALAPLSGWTIPVDMPEELCCNIPPEEFYTFQYKGQAENTEFPLLIVALGLLVLVAYSLGRHFYLPEKL